MNENLDKTLAAHPFFQGLTAQYLKEITECASQVRFDKGQIIFRHGEDAQTFYLIQHGSVTLELFTSDRGAIIIDTLEEGEVLGFSWLFAPHQWQFDAQATSLVRALAIDGTRLLAKCEADPRLGYEMLKRFSQLVLHRLQSTRLQLLDVYGQGR